MSHSPDKLWWWDGSTWVRAVSPDGAWWFDGQGWVPNRAPATKRVPTEWTRPLQAAVMVLLLVALPLGGWVFASIEPAMRDSMLAGARVPPGSDPAAFRSGFDAVMSGMLGVAAVVTLAWLALLIVGTLKRWTWMYWVLMVSAVLSVLALPGQVAQLFGVGTPMGLNGAAFHEPRLLAGIEIVLGLYWLALFVWMVRAYQRYGPWAQKKVPA